VSSVDDRIAFLTVPGLGRGAFATLADAVLRALQRAVTRAWVDAVTDGDWRPEQQPDLDRLARLETDQLMAGTRRRRTGMGIDIDLRRENELALLARLAPFTIHAEGWARDASVFSFDDCGDGAWCALTPAEAEQIAGRLRAHGLEFEALLEPDVG